MINGLRSGPPHAEQRAWWYWAGDCGNRVLVGLCRRTDGHGSACRASEIQTPSLVSPIPSSPHKTPVLHPPAVVCSSHPAFCLRPPLPGQPCPPPPLHTPAPVLAASENRHLPHRRHPPHAATRISSQESTYSTPFYNTVRGPSALLRRPPTARSSHYAPTSAPVAPLAASCLPTLTTRHSPPRHLL